MEMANLVILLSCLWIWNPATVNGRTDSSDASALNTLFSSLNSPSQLTGWTQSGGDPCGDSWKGIKCTDSSVTAIKLSGLGLTGTFYNLNTMTSLVELDMSNNNLGNGGSIPYNLPPNLNRLNLASNQFTQGIPFSISQMASLEYLNLGHNHLQGISDMFYNLPNLATMDLSSNSISGDLPQSFSALSSLTTLYLQNNQFTGSINVLTSLPLNDLDVENNHFTGWIPDQLKKINNLQIGGNSWSTGPAPPPPPFTPPPGRKINPGESNDGNSKKSGIGGGGIAGIIISLLVVGAIIGFFFVRQRMKKSSINDQREQDEPLTPHTSDEFKEMKPVQTSSSFNTRIYEPAVPVDFNPPPVAIFKSYGEEDTSSKPVLRKNKSGSIKATTYSVADLQVATNSFSADNLIGEGSIGRVFRAQLNNGKVVAVKKINSSVLPSNSTDYFLDIVSDISKLHHPNLTDLIGYCSEHGQHLLVYQFEQNGSLHDVLHDHDEYSKPLSWNTRIKIALGTARALEYLHEVCSPSIVHKNLKTANVLLDVELNPHLSDSGLASLIPDSESQQALDHSAPEVSMSGQYTLKTDVYSFGVVMLELLTGRKCFDSTRPWSEQSLVRWATPQLHDIDALDKMVDPALQGLYPAKSLSRFADVIALCVQSEPEFRPPMSEVVEALVRLVQRANMTKRMLGGEGSDSMKDYMM